MDNGTEQRTVGICETQPVTIEGVRCLLNGCSDLQFIGGVTSLPSSGGMANASQWRPLSQATVQSPNWTSLGTGATISEAARVRIAMSRR